MGEPKGPARCSTKCSSYVWSSRKRCPGHNGSGASRTDVFVDGLISDLAMEYLCRIVVAQVFSIFTDVFTDGLISGIHGSHIS
ncbi:unnamed protein product [Urochloa humidicola]